jgi:lysozyme family protein
MADPNIAITLTLRNEGGFVDNPADPGGATNMGITQRDMPGANIKDLTAAQAITYYLAHFWLPLYGGIEDQFFANKIFDMGVLFGLDTATKLLQGILKLTLDGEFGPLTLAAVNEADPHSLLIAYKTVLVQHAIDVGGESAGLRQFVIGWIRRVNS